MYITDDIKYIGCDDIDLNYFENQYEVLKGVSYNSYLILDKYVCVLDTIDIRKKEEWLENLNNSLNGRNVDYLVVSHLEPDHSSCIKTLCDIYPNMKVVLSTKAKSMIGNFCDIKNELVEVKENDTLSLGNHTLKFIMAPMVHWPEVMVEYDLTSKILFSADAFGKFGAVRFEEDWKEEARRYYINIVGKYGSPVQTLLKKASTLDIKMIAPLHGPILKDDLGYYLDLYNKWSTYESEDNGVLIAVSSLHGNTLEASYKLKEILDTKNINNEFINLNEEDLSYAVSLAFKYKNMILLAPTYDGFIFNPTEDFLTRLAHKSYQNRTVALIENGSWAPMANKLMADKLTQMKNITILDKKITIKTKMTNENIEEMKELVKLFK